MSLGMWQEVSADEVFRVVEFHGKAAGDEDMNRFETLVLEAKRSI